MYPLLILCGKAGSGKDTVAGFLAQDHGAAVIAQADPLKRFAHDVFGFTEDQLWGPSSSRNAPDPRPASEFQRRYNVGAYVAEKWLEDIGLHRYQFQLDKWFQTHISTVEGLTPRHLLQTLGTEFGRRIAPQVWVKYAHDMADRLLEQGGRYDRLRGYDLGFNARPKLVVISDGRFPNEVLAVKKSGGIAINVINPADEVLAGAAGAHSSETGLDQVPQGWFDAKVDNDKTQGLEPLRGLVTDVIETVMPGPRLFRAQADAEDEEL